MPKREEIEKLKKYIGKKVVAVLSSKFQVFNFKLGDKGMKTEDSSGLKEMEGVLKDVNVSFLTLETIEGEKTVWFYSSGGWSGDEPGSGGGGNYQSRWDSPQEIKLVKTENVPIYLNSG